MRPIHLKDSSLRGLSRAFPRAPLSGLRKWDRMKFKAFDLEFTTHVLATGTLTLHFPALALSCAPTHAPLAINVANPATAVNLIQKLRKTRLLLFRSHTSRQLVAC